MGHVADPANVGVAMLFRKPELITQMTANLVAVENLDPMTSSHEHVRDGVRECCLAGAGQAGEPHDEACAGHQMFVAAGGRVAQCLRNVYFPAVRAEWSAPAHQVS
jgi:hypothetical protein